MNQKFDEKMPDPNSAAVEAVEVQLINLPELDNFGQSPKSVQRSILNGVNPLHAVKAKLQVHVGDVEISVGELLNLKENQVISLNTMVDQPIDLLLEGYVVARGSLVAVDGQFAIQVTELPLPLKP